MGKPLTPEEIAAALDAAGPDGSTLRTAGWTWADDALAKTYRWPDFKQALAFMVRAGFEAEALNHHPEWTNVYGRVAVRLCTHDAGDRVTALDVALARRLEAIARA